MFEKTLADQASQDANTALKSTQRAAGQAFDNVGAAVDRGLERARDASRQMRDGALHMSQGAASAIRHDPVKSVLIAAATGAALMALVSLLTRPHNRN